jgi:hypothetical protein
MLSKAQRQNKATGSACGGRVVEGTGLEILSVPYFLLLPHTQLSQFVGIFVA